MIKLKNSVIERLGNSRALKNLADCKDLPIDLSFELDIFIETVFNQQFIPVLKVLQEKRREHILAYCDKDDEGKPVLDENKMYVFDVNGPKFMEVSEELGNMEVEFNCNKLVISKKDIPRGVLSPNDIGTLRSTIVDFVDDKPSKKKEG